jgi:hypothetical protein
VSKLISLRRKEMARLQLNKLRLSKSIRRSSQKADKLRKEIKYGLRSNRILMKRRLRIMSNKKIVNQIFRILMKMILIRSKPLNHIKFRLQKMKMIMKIS